MLTRFRTDVVLCVSCMVFNVICIILQKRSCSGRVNCLCDCSDWLWLVPHDERESFRRSWRTVPLLVFCYMSLTIDKHPRQPPLPPVKFMCVRDLLQLFQMIWPFGAPASDLWPAVSAQTLHHTAGVLSVSLFRTERDVNRLKQELSKSARASFTASVSHRISQEN